MYDKKILAQNLRMFRAKFDFSQFDLAVRLNISEQSVINYENERGNMSLELACQIADTFGISLNELCGIPFAAQKEACL